MPCDGFTLIHNDRVYAYERSAAPDASVPFIASRGEIGAPPPVDHPGPWRWGENWRHDTALLDARGNELLSARLIEAGEVEPVVLRMAAGAKQLFSGVTALLAIVSEAHHDGWRPKSDDVGPICANLRLLLDSIDDSWKPR